MSTKAIRNILLRFREKCGSEAEMLPGERAAYRGALAEVEAIEEAAKDMSDALRHVHTYSLDTGKCSCGHASKDDSR